MCHIVLNKHQQTHRGQSRWYACVRALRELKAGGGGGNIKQRFCVLSSHCLDRTPPRPNEVFVRLCQPLLLTHMHDNAHSHTSLYILVLFILPGIFIKEQLKVTEGFTKGCAHTSLQHTKWKGSALQNHRNAYTWHNADKRRWIFHSNYIALIAKSHTHTSTRAHKHKRVSYLSYRLFSTPSQRISGELVQVCCFWCLRCILRWLPIAPQRPAHKGISVMWMIISCIKTD